MVAFAQVCLCDLQVFPSILVALDVWFLALLLFLFSGGKINDVPLKQVHQSGQVVVFSSLPHSQPYCI